MVHDAGRRQHAGWRRRGGCSQGTRKGRVAEPRAQRPHRHKHRGAWSPRADRMAWRPDASSHWPGPPSGAWGSRANGWRRRGGRSEEASEESMAEPSARAATHRAAAPASQPKARAPPGTAIQKRGSSGASQQSGAPVAMTASYASSRSPEGARADTQLGVAAVSSSAGRPRASGAWAIRPAGEPEGPPTGRLPREWNPIAAGPNTWARPTCSVLQLRPPAQWSPVATTSPGEAGRRGHRVREPLRGVPPVFDVSISDE